MSNDRLPPNPNGTQLMPQPRLYDGFKSLADITLTLSPVPGLPEGMNVFEPDGHDWDCVLPDMIPPAEFHDERLIIAPQVGLLNGHAMARSVQKESICPTNILDTLRTAASQTYLAEHTEHTFCEQREDNFVLTRVSDLSDWLGFARVHRTLGWTVDGNVDLVIQLDTLYMRPNYHAQTFANLLAGSLARYFGEEMDAQSLTLFPHYQRIRPTLLVNRKLDCAADLSELMVEQFDFIPSSFRHRGTVPLDDGFEVCIGPGVPRVSIDKIISLTG